MKKEWEVKKLGDIISLEYGKPLGKSKRKLDGLYPVYGANGIINRTNTFLINKKSIIVGRKGSAGEINYSEDSFWPLDVTYYIKYNENEVYLDFLFYLLKQLDLPKLAKGVKPGINRNDVYSIKTTIPTLSEQKQIVSTIDKCFSAIDHAKTNIEKNLKNAKEIFQSELNSIFTNKGEGWEEKTLGEMIEIRNGKNQQGVLSESGKYKIMGSAGNIMGYATDFICEAGTTIIGRKGNISKPIYINERFWNVDTAFGFYPKNENVIDKRFVYYVCLGIDFKSMNRGTTIPSLVKSELQTININFPKSLKVQEVIVHKLDKLSSECKELETLYQQKLNYLEDLKKSILQKAFNGELKTI